MSDIVLVEANADPPCYEHVHSPIGRLTLVADDSAIVGLYFPDHRYAPSREGWLPRRDAPLDARDLLTEARSQLRAYFAGHLRAFDLPCEPRGTPFQKLVWDALRDIPFAGIVTYGEIARHIGAPLAFRAVGGANARNPVSIILPCHRVIGIEGALTGYGGGVERKRWLLSHERRAVGLEVSETRRERQAGDRRA
jgi:methylated-DNA-[protein]-cysteine S-methyltransferase